MEEISYTDPMRNEEVLQKVKEKKNTLHTIKSRRPTGLVICCLGTASILKKRYRDV
jgi:transcription initiation factor TFIIIB Brf1 subunit/transcription initiation factor TFIIB